MQGWKTWAGAGLIVVGAACHVFGIDTVAETAYALGASMVGIGLGHKLEKVLRQVGTGATAAADQLSKLPAEEPKA